MAYGITVSYRIPKLTYAVEKGHEFLLMSKLYLSRGKPIKKDWTIFSFPPYWFYDILTVLDYFQSYKNVKIDDKKMQSV